MAIVPNMINIKQKSTIMSNIIGMELRIVDTKLLIPGIELMVLRGRKILITLIAEILSWFMKVASHPRITTRKSSYEEC